MSALFAQPQSHQFGVDRISIKRIMLASRNWALIKYVFHGRTEKYEDDNTS